MRATSMPSERSCRGCRADRRGRLQCQQLVDLCLFDAGSSTRIRKRKSAEIQQKLDARRFVVRKRRTACRARDGRRRGGDRIVVATRDFWRHVPDFVTARDHGNRLREIPILAFWNQRGRERRRKPLHSLDVRVARDHRDAAEDGLTHIAILSSGSLVRDPITRVEGEVRTRRMR
jgi:hypothetical protein